MRPREIQARIRAGASVEQVAAAAGVPEQKIERFAYPVLLERLRTAEVAQRAHPVRVDGPDNRTLAEVVAHTFGLRGQEYEGARWDSWKGDDGRWVVALSWRAGRSDNRAHWTFQPGAHGGTVAALDEHASDLVEGLPARPLRTVGAVVDMARPEEEPPPAPSPVEQWRAAASDSYRERMPPGEPGRHPTAERTVERPVPRTPEPWRPTPPAQRQAEPAPEPRGSHRVDVRPTEPREPAHRMPLERPAAERVAVERVSADRVSADRVAAERPVGTEVRDAVAAELTRVEPARAEQARAEQARPEQARPEQARAEQARAEQARAQSDPSFPPSRSSGSTRAITPSAAPARTEPVAPPTPPARTAPVTPVASAVPTTPATPPAPSAPPAASAPVSPAPRPQAAEPTPSVPGTPAVSDTSGEAPAVPAPAAAAPAPAAPAPAAGAAATEAAAAEAPAPEPPANRRTKKGKPVMPSWDEVLLGVRKPR